MTRQNIERWLNKQNLIKNTTYEVSFAEKVYYDYYKDKSNYKTFVNLMDYKDALFFGDSCQKFYEFKSVTKKLLESKLKEYRN